MTEFWQDEITNKSYIRLMELKKEFDFVLIGGWAIYLHTKAYKSKDIDIIIDYPQLTELKAKYNCNKNDFLKKYEIKEDHFDIDIYLPHYSDLSYPTEKILQDFVIIDGFKVVNAEELVILKQGAYTNRKGTIKGKKDSLDIVLILIHTNFDFKKYFEKIKTQKLENYKLQLKEIIQSITDNDIQYLKIIRTDFLKRKKAYLSLL